MEEKRKEPGIGRLIVVFLLGTIKGVLLGYVSQIFVCIATDGNASLIVLILFTVLGIASGIAEFVGLKTDIRKENQAIEQRNAEFMKQEEMRILQERDRQLQEEKVREAERLKKEKEAARREKEHAQRREVAAMQQEEYRQKRGKTAAQTMMARYLQSRSLHSVEDVTKVIQGIVEEFRPVAEQTLADFVKELQEQINKNMTSIGRTSGGAELLFSKIIEDLNYLYAITGDMVWKNRKESAVEYFQAYQERIYAAVLDNSHYGKVNEAFMDMLKGINTAQANAEFDSLYEAFDAGAGCGRFDVRINQIVKYLWFFALATPYDAKRFEEAKTMYNFFNAQYISKTSSDTYLLTGLNVILAELYITKNLGDSVMQQKWRDNVYWLKYYTEQKNTQACDNLASGAKWLEAYKLEAEVLKKMATEGLLTRADRQERLRNLEGASDERMVIHKVEPKENQMIFEYASVNWSNEEFVRFFKNLLFENKKLIYAMAIREWSKTLSMQAGQSMKMENMYGYLKKKIEEEYETSVVCKMQKCAVLADGMQDEMHGILLQPNKDEIGFSHINLLLNVIKIGKNLSIRIYTLSVPEMEELEKQEQKTLSLKRNLNPNVVAFEEGLRESLLLALTEYINSEHVETQKMIVTEELKEEQEY